LMIGLKNRTNGDGRKLLVVHVSLCLEVEGGIEMAYKKPSYSVLGTSLLFLILGLLFLKGRRDVGSG
jgi:hypothetical protein